jgi:hypothetical protein
MQVEMEEHVPFLAFDPREGSPPSQAGYSSFWPRTRAHRGIGRSTSNANGGVRPSFVQPWAPGQGGTFLQRMRREYQAPSQSPAAPAPRALSRLAGIAAASNRQRAFTSVQKEVEEDFVASQPQVQVLLKERADSNRATLSARASVAPPCVCGSCAAAPTGAHKSVQIISLDNCSIIQVPLFKCGACHATLHASPGSINCFPATGRSWDLSGTVHRWLELGLLELCDRLVHVGGHPSVHGLATALHAKFTAAADSEKISFHILKKVLNDSILVWFNGNGVSVHVLCQRGRPPSPPTPPCPPIQRLP